MSMASYFSLLCCLNLFLSQSFHKTLVYKNKPHHVCRPLGGGSFSPPDVSHLCWDGLLTGVTGHHGEAPQSVQETSH